MQYKATSQGKERMSSQKYIAFYVWIQQKLKRKNELCTCTPATVAAKMLSDPFVYNLVILPHSISGKVMIVFTDID